MDVLLPALLVLLLLAALGLAVALLVGALRRRRLVQGLRERANPTDPMAAPTTWDARRLAPGDVVIADGVEHVVRGTLALEEDGEVWKEHLLDASGLAGDVRRWLSVEDGESGLELALWTRVTGADLEPAPELELDGVRYRRDEHGRATYAATGTTGTAPSGTMRYADFVEVGGDRLLALEQWSQEGSWEASTGVRVDPGSLTVLHS